MSAARMTDDEYKAYLARRSEQVAKAKAKGKSHKYSATAVVIDGIRFDSKREGRYYTQLKLRIDAGEVFYFHRQVPIQLPGGVTYRVDFLEFWADGSIHYVDVKGFETPEFKMKKKMVEDLFPIEIEVVK